jgi:hypothetical protein
MIVIFSFVMAGSRRRASIRRSAAALLVAFATVSGATVEGRQVAPERKPPPPPPSAATPVERLGPTTLRVGNVQVDTAKREVSVAGVVNEGVTALEFIASTKGGFKGYESALELDTTAIDFNLGLILIGLDHNRAVVPKFHLQPTPPQGDPVEIWVEWTEREKPRRVRAEELVFNETTKQTLSEGPWVYTGSVFSAQNNAYLADLEGALIGFVHSPAPVIDSPRAMSPGQYGSNRLNASLNLQAGTRVVLTVRALPLPK